MKRQETSLYKSMSSLFITIKVRNWRKWVRKRERPRERDRQRQREIDERIKYRLTGDNYIDLFLTAFCVNIHSLKSLPRWEVVLNWALAGHFPKLLTARISSSSPTDQRREPTSIKIHNDYAFLPLRDLRDMLPAVNPRESSCLNSWNILFEKS